MSDAQVVFMGMILVVVSFISGWRCAKVWYEIDEPEDE